MSGPVAPGGLTAIGVELQDPAIAQPASGAVAHSARSAWISTA